MYKWARYTAVAYTYYTDVHSNGYPQSSQAYRPSFTGYDGGVSFSSSTGTYTGTGSYKTIMGISGTGGNQTVYTINSDGKSYIKNTIGSPISADSDTFNVTFDSYYSQSNTTYFQGVYIDDVYSDIRTTYPDAGKQGDYWYIYLGEAFNLYVNIDGVSKQVQGVYVNIDGVSKQVQGVYVNIDGVSKQV